MVQHMPGDTVTPGQNHDDQMNKPESKADQNEDSNKEIKKADDVSWKFNQDHDGDQNKPPIDHDNGSKGPTLTWDASEFIAHQKSTVWYVYLFTITIVAAGLIFLLTKDKITTAVIVIAGLIFGFYATRKPHDVRYQLDDNGVTVGQKYYDYNAFKSFSIIHDNDSSSLAFVPLKRFMPRLYVFYRHQDEKKIMDILVDQLPFEQRRDAIDNFLRWIHY